MTKPILILVQDSTFTFTSLSFYLFPPEWENLPAKQLFCWWQVLILDPVWSNDWTCERFSPLTAKVCNVLYGGRLLQPQGKHSYSALEITFFAVFLD
jgi:hypothetical protein